MYVCIYLCKHVCVCVCVYQTGDEQWAELGYYQKQYWGTQFSKVISFLTFRSKITSWALTFQKFLQADPARSTTAAAATPPQSERVYVSVHVYMYTTYIFTDVTGRCRDPSAR
jgi:hypothetical protein